MIPPQSVKGESQTGFQSHPLAVTLYPWSSLSYPTIITKKKKIKIKRHQPFIRVILSGVYRENVNLKKKTERRDYSLILTYVKDLLSLTA